MQLAKFWVTRCLSRLTWRPSSRNPRLLHCAAQLGGWGEQNPPRQLMPVAAAQQSALVVHFSEICAQPSGSPQILGDDGSEASLGRQAPSQHSSPFSQLAALGLQGSRAQKPRSFLVSV